MAFNKLRQLKLKFESNWLNGDFIFGYENEINENHNNEYPLLLVLPPTSEIPSADDGMQEEYTFECLLVTPLRYGFYKRLEDDFSLLEQEGLVWLQRVLDSYTKKEVILSPDSISVEREKELYNDKLIQIRLTFTLNCFSHTFTQIDNLTISNLSPKVWLRADLGVKKNIKGAEDNFNAELVNKWIDQSGNGNHFEQTSEDLMPTYEYANAVSDFPALQFTNDSLKCVNKGINGGTGISSSHTIIFNGILLTTGGSLLSKNDASTPNFNITQVGSLPSSNFYQANYNDINGDNPQINSSPNLTSTKAITAVRLDGTTLSTFTNGVQVDSDTDPDFGGFTNFGNSNAMTIGSNNAGTGSFGTILISELIIFNTALSATQIKAVSDILKHKHNI